MAEGLCLNIKFSTSVIVVSVDYAKILEEANTSNEACQDRLEISRRFHRAYLALALAGIPGDSLQAMIISLMEFILYLKVSSCHVTGIVFKRACVREPIMIDFPIYFSTQRLGLPVTCR